MKSLSFRLSFSFLIFPFFHFPDNTVGVSLSQTVSKLFRYEHNSWDQGFLPPLSLSLPSFSPSIFFLFSRVGFVIKKRSITEFSPTIVVSTDRNFGLDKVSAHSTFIFFLFLFFFPDFFSFISPFPILSSSHQVVAESSLDHIQVCPSHPLFGQKENTVTYYIFLQSSRETTLEITIESLSTDEGIGLSFFFPSPLFPSYSTKNSSPNPILYSCLLCLLVL